MIVISLSVNLFDPFQDLLGAVHILGIDFNLGAVLLLDQQECLISRDQPPGHLYTWVVIANCWRVFVHELVADTIAGGYAAALIHDAGRARQQDRGLQSIRQLLKRNHLQLGQGLDCFHYKIIRLCSHFASCPSNICQKAKCLCSVLLVLMRLGNSYRWLCCYFLSYSIWGSLFLSSVVDRFRVIGLLCWYDFCIGVTDFLYSYALQAIYCFFRFLECPRKRLCQNNYYLLSSTKGSTFLKALVLTVLSLQILEFESQVATLLFRLSPKYMFRMHSRSASRSDTNFPSEQLGLPLPLGSLKPTYRLIISLCLMVYLSSLLSIPSVRIATWLFILGRISNDSFVLWLFFRSSFYWSVRLMSNTLLYTCDGKRSRIMYPFLKHYFDCSSRPIRDSWSATWVIHFVKSPAECSQILPLASSENAFSHNLMLSSRQFIQCLTTASLSRMRAMPNGFSGYILRYFFSTSSACFSLPSAIMGFPIRQQEQAREHSVWLFRARMLGCLCLLRLLIRTSTLSNCVMACRACSLDRLAVSIACLLALTISCKSEANINNNHQSALKGVLVTTHLLYSTMHSNFLEQLQWWPFYASTSRRILLAKCNFEWSIVGNRWWAMWMLKPVKNMKDTQAFQPSSLSLVEIIVCSAKSWTLWSPSDHSFAWRCPQKMVLVMMKPNSPWKTTNSLTAQTRSIPPRYMKKGIYVRQARHQGSKGSPRSGLVIFRRMLSGTMTRQKGWRSSSVQIAFGGNVFRKQTSGSKTATQQSMLVLGQR